MPQIPEDKFKELETFHQQWLENPLTTMAIQAIVKHKEELWKSMETNSMNPSASNEMLRGQLYASKSIETVIAMLKNFSLIAKRLEIESTPTTTKE